MEKKENRTEDSSPIRIDYDNLDVADIMAQVKARIAERPAEPAPEASPTGGTRPDLPSSSYPVPPEPPSGARSRVKRILLKVMKPFTPLIKLAVLPVNEELVRTVEALDYTNRKLAYLSARLDRGIEQLDQRLSSRLTYLDRDFNDKIDRHTAQLERVDGDLNLAAEYTKLLHNLSHNLVVELTKLKVEQETLKSTVRILEKDFALLGKREKAMESRVFK